MTTSVTHPSDEWEAIFERATEDLGEYLERLEDWCHAGEQPPSGIEMIRLLSARARSRRAAGLIETEAPETYRPYSDKLLRLWRTARDHPDEQIAAAQSCFEDAIRDSMEIVSDVEQELGHVRNIAKDSFLMEDDGSISQDLREAAHTFLLRFQMLAHSADELGRTPLDRLDEASRFCARFSKLEARLDRDFGYFFAIADLLPAIHDREYHPDHWWLSRKRSPDDIDTAPAVDDLIRAVQKAPPNPEMADGDDCPLAEQTMAYALDEIPAETRSEAKSHIASCAHCMSLFFDVRAAAIESAEDNASTASLNPTLQKAISEAVQAPRPAKSSYWNAISDFFQRLLSSIFVPKALPILAACCLVIFISAQLYLNQNIPINATLTLHTRPPATRSGDVPSVKMIKPGETLFTGDNYQIRIQADKDGYGYVFLLGQSGRLKMLYKGPIQAGVPLSVPGEAQWGRLDPYRGMETILLVVAKDSIENMSHKIEELKRTGPDQAETIFDEATVKHFNFIHK